MAAGEEEKAPEAQEDECVLCHRSDTSLDGCGLMLKVDGVCAHVHCLYPAQGLYQRGAEGEGIFRFLCADIRRVAGRAARKRCCVCRKKGATVACRQKRCSRRFHLPCSSQRGCISQFFGEYSSFCWEHRPQQTVETLQEGHTTCIICMEVVEDSLSYTTMVCPSCKHAWFHRACIQGQALGALALLLLCRQRDPPPMLRPWGHHPAVGVRWLCWPRHCSQLLSLTTREESRPWQGAAPVPQPLQPATALIPAWGQMLHPGVPLPDRVRLCTCGRPSWRGHQGAPSAGSTARRDRGDAAGGAHHVHHLHGGGGGQPVLHHHGVPLLQARLVPPGLHPGRRPFPLTARRDTMRPSSVLLTRGISLPQGQALGALALLLLCRQRDPPPMLRPWGHHPAVGVRWLRWPRHCSQLLSLTTREESRPWQGAAPAPQPLQPATALIPAWGQKIHRGVPLPDRVRLCTCSRPSRRGPQGGAQWGNARTQRQAREGTLREGLPSQGRTASL
eukprot:XP_027320208.1 uncharacterized protein LOC113844471 isoform X2 [Anas platyrhynchos]